MNWQGTKVLVTGATERLVELGANVRAMIHDNALGAGLGLIARR